MSFSSADPQLKEVERLGPRKGVISQSVKDVLQSLVDDDLVCRDKIGTSVSHRMTLHAEETIHEQDFTACGVVMCDRDQKAIMVLLQSTVDGWESVWIPTWDVQLAMVTIFD